MTHIVYGIDDKYLPCLLVSMYSTLITVSGPIKITVFVARPRIEDTSDIQTLSGHFPNATVDIRRFDAGELEEYEKSATSERFSAASMIPLFIPWLIDEKCLFLDADTLVLHDISKLYHTDLKGCLIGACRASSESVSQHKYFTSILRTLSFQRGRRRRKEFLEKAARIGFSIQEMASRYFSSGVILMDTAAIRRADPSGELMNINSSRKHWELLPDMDRLNEFFKYETHYLDLKWNVYRDCNPLDRLFAPPELWAEIFQAAKSPGLLHYPVIFGRQSWQRPWYKSRKRYRIYRRICREMEESTGIPIFRLFGSRLAASGRPKM